MEHLVLHEDVRSGNCYKIRLAAAHAGVAIERRGYDILRGETRTPEFLAGVNPNGRIPVLQIGDAFLPESNAACFYLGKGTQLVPEDRLAEADMLRWMFWEQYSHEPNVATLRFWRRYVGEDQLTQQQRALLPVKFADGAAALALMDAHLATRDFFVGRSLTLADIVLYPYTHVAAEGGFDLDGSPNLRAWMGRVASHPRHIGLDD